MRKTLKTTGSWFETRIRQIDEIVSNLLDNITPTNRDLVDRRIRELKREIEELTARKEGLEVAGRRRVDVEDVVTERCWIRC